MTHIPEKANDNITRQQIVYAIVDKHGFITNLNDCYATAKQAQADLAEIQETDSRYAGHTVKPFFLMPVPNYLIKETPVKCAYTGKDYIFLKDNDE